MNHERKEAQPSGPCFEHSEQPDELKKLLNDIKFEYEIDGIRKYFPDDKEERLTLNIFLTRNEHTIEFTFGMSINDTAVYQLKPVPIGYPQNKGDTSRDRFNKKRKLFDDLVYSVLASVAWTSEEVRALPFFLLLVDGNCCDEVVIKRCPKCNPKLKRLETWQKS